MRNPRIISSEQGFTDPAWAKPVLSLRGAERLRAAISRVHRVDIEAADELNLTLLPLLNAVNKILDPDHFAEGLDELDDWLKGRI